MPRRFSGGGGRCGRGGIRGQHNTLPVVRLGRVWLSVVDFVFEDDRIRVPLRLQQRDAHGAAVRDGVCPDDVHGFARLPGGLDRLRSLRLPAREVGGLGEVGRERNGVLVEVVRRLARRDAGWGDCRVVGENCKTCTSTVRCSSRERGSRVERGRAKVDAGGVKSRDVGRRRCPRVCVRNEVAVRAEIGVVRVGPLQDACNRKGRLE